VSNTSLVRPLFEGPLDIVGDVHGEIDALCNLMKQLGYSDDGLHSDGRRLVFLGDLTDRGPDSPAVVDLVERLVSTGTAQCVLGNHDLNILLRHRKYDNDWFFGHTFLHEGRIVPQKLADEAIRESVPRFFRTLPLVLERPGLRVVHACWMPQMVDVARQGSNAKRLYNGYRKLIDTDNERRPLLDDTDRDLQHQNRNPVKVLTSGIEERLDSPQWAGGRLRHLGRVSWWKDYEDSEVCVFGHYSLRPDMSNASCRAVCVDFGVGKRYEERVQPDFEGQYASKLAALQIPERRLVFDDGSSRLLSDYEASSLAVSSTTGIRQISNRGLSLGSIPDQTADWGDIERFAYTFDGYDHRKDVSDCGEISRRVQGQYKRGGAPMATVTDLRIALFFEARSAHHTGEQPGKARMKYIRAIVESIRNSVEAFRQ